MMESIVTEMYMSAEALIPLIREMMESMQMTRPLYWMGKLI